jgi:eukaryotic-like serine/threonine-protein kinase
MAAHLSGALDPAQSELMSAHFDVCEDCREEAQALVRARALLSTTAPSQMIDRAQAPERIGRYLISHLLGRGGMGEVYAARDLELKRMVALKVMRSDVSIRHPELATRLKRESQLLARISNPAVIAVYDVGSVDDIVFIAMELIDGETLGAWLRRKPRPWPAVVDVFRRAGQGLLAAHQSGILHRDFKPENVLLSRGPQSLMTPQRPRAIPETLI